ncbi:Imm40 family immunity protein [Aliirhizobium smilacinae]|nr:Imm40 family immunity protein [Rhizobium smilacinae]
MIIAWSAEIDAILSIGRPLFPEHRNWALSRPEALSALAELRKRGIGVLGGDLLVFQSGRFEHTYDNWHCDPVEHERNDVFVNRSINAAIGYVEAYPEGESPPFFVIVPLRTPCA